MRNFVFRRNQVRDLRLRLRSAAKARFGCFQAGVRDCCAPLLLTMLVWLPACSVRSRRHPSEYWRSLVLLFLCKRDLLILASTGDLVDRPVRRGLLFARVLFSRFNSMLLVRSPALFIKRTGIMAIGSAPDQTTFLLHETNTTS